MVLLILAESRLQLYWQIARNGGCSGDPRPQTFLSQAEDALETSDHVIERLGIKSRFYGQA